MQSFDVLTSDQGLEVHMATYAPEIDQSQHMKSVSHLINIIFIIKPKLNKFNNILYL